ncbi:MAG TPA: hypothetical protein VFI97_01360 [Arthrobacter sp.]|nr:hypothetical protein [Arthrobacter sp.]
MKKQHRTNTTWSAAVAWLLLQVTAMKLFPDRSSGDDQERGDVPGWVMITLMSAVLVAGLLALAGPALEGLFQSAINQVRQ